MFVANDDMALGVLKALHEKGRRVPEDVSVVGFDDVPEAAFYWPGLTTVKQDFSALGRCAVELTLRALEGEDEPSLDLVQPEVVVRDSSGRMVVMGRTVPDDVVAATRARYVEAYERLTGLPF